MAGKQWRKRATLLHTKQYNKCYLSKVSEGASPLVRKKLGALRSCPNHSHCWLHHYMEAKVLRKALALTITS